MLDCLRSARFAVPSTLLLAGAYFMLPGILVAQESLAKTSSDYVLGLGDALTISVWKNPELSASVEVRPDGKISLPLIGDLAVAGLKPTEVESTLRESYSEFVKAPAVSVVVNQINSLKVYIIGEVGSSGAFDVLSPTTLMQALAMAGGFAEYAKKDEVVILREGGPDWKRKVVNVKGIISGKTPQDNILLQAGDTVIVP